MEREGNTVKAETVNVSSFRILVSPAEFDLQEAVRVEVDGRVAFDEKVEPSIATLLHWAARDDDRKRLFAAEIPIDL